MYEVRPGTVVTLDRRGLRERVYWRLETRPHTDGRDGTVGRVRERSTVALSGESADEVFGGDLAAALDLPGYVAGSYATAVGEIERLAGESDHEWRMRKICYLELTRMLGILLDRKDRTSTAVGLEVRVPYCDHRLVEVRVQHPLVAEDLRRQGEEPAAAGRQGRPASRPWWSG